MHRELSDVIYSKDDFLGSFRNPESPEARSGVQTLSERGLLPLTICSPYFPALNILASYVFWGGGTHKSTFMNRTQYGAWLAVKYHVSCTVPCAVMPAIEVVEDELQLALEKEVTGRGRVKVTFGHMESLYARLLGHLTGKLADPHHTSTHRRKSYVQKQLRTPQYIRQHMQSLHDPLSHVIVEDWVRAMFFRKLRQDGHRLHMLHQRTPEDAKLLTYSVIEALNAAYPELRLSEDNIARLNVTNYEGKRSYTRDLIITEVHRRVLAAANVLHKDGTKTYQHAYGAQRLSRAV